LESMVTADAKRALPMAMAGKVPRVLQFATRRFVEMELARGEKAEFDWIVQSFARAEDPVRRDLFLGIREGLRGRKSVAMPKSWPDVFALLMKCEEADIRESARQLAVIFGDPKALALLRMKVAAVTTPLAERKIALEALIDKRIEGLPEFLFEILSDRSLRSLAIRGLAAVPHEKTAERILERYAEFTAEEKQLAVATLASRKESAFALLDAVEKKLVKASDVSAFTARQLYAIQDNKLTERLRTTWGEIRETGPKKLEQIAKFKKMLTPAYLKTADLANGRLLYSKNCQQCHTLFGEGAKIGPDLTGSNRSNLDYLLSNIIDPSAEVGKDFRISIVSTVDGRLITGIAVERSPTRVVIQTEKERVTFSSDDVESIKDSPLSMMPEGQLDPLTKEQVRDLIGYLASEKQVPLPGVK
jgi:putative heme-binding domain-containing protein